MSATPDKVVILDRDGTMVVDRPYSADPAKLEFMPGAAEGLRAMHAQGYRLVVITNQSGVGRGLFPLEAVQRMNVRLAEMVCAAGARLEGVYTCPHRPEDRCACRKPAIKLLRDAAADLGFDPSRAVVIGDRDSDVLFGANAGATTMRVNCEDEQLSHPEAARADFVVRDLVQAAELLRKRG